jgi:hypothetical protein
LIQECTPISPVSKSPKFNLASVKKLKCQISQTTQRQNAQF